MTRTERLSGSESLRSAARQLAARSAADTLIPILSPTVCSPRALPYFFIPQYLHSYHEQHRHTITTQPRYRDCSVREVVPKV